MEKKDCGRGRGRARGRGCGNFRINLEQEQRDDIQSEWKALDQRSLSKDTEAERNFETLKSKFEDDIVATVSTAAATQQEGSQGKLEGLQAEVAEKNPENFGVQNEGEGASTVGKVDDDYVPSNLIDAAGEFRAHANPDLNRISHHFFCCICGCPAGGDCWMCRKRGHLVCKLCRAELNNFTECHYVLDNIMLCNSKIVKMKSPLGKAIFEITTVSCKYRQNGCRTEGPWKVVQKHQKRCRFVKKPPRA